MKTKMLMNMMKIYRVELWVHEAGRLRMKEIALKTMSKSAAADLFKMHESLSPKEEVHLAEYTITRRVLKKSKWC